MKYKFIQDKDPWFLAEHFPNIDFFFSQIWLSSFVNDLSNSCGKNYKKVLAIFYPKHYIHFYYGEKDSLNFEKYLVQKIKKDISFGKNINKNIYFWSDKLNNLNNKISKLNLKKLKNNDLWKLIKEQDTLHTHLYQWGWLSNATDMFHNTFTNEMNLILRKKIKNHSVDHNETFNILTTPENKSVALIQDESLEKIGLLLKKNKFKFNKLIEKKLYIHYKKYFYLKYLWIGPGVYTKDYYKKAVLKIAKRDKKIVNQNTVITRVKKQKKYIYTKLNFSKKEIDLFQVYSEFMLTKIYRRYAQIRWAYEMGKVLAEVAKRFKITLAEVRYLTPTELKNVLLQGKIDKVDLKKRFDYFLYYVEKDKEFFTTDKNNLFIKQFRKVKNTEKKVSVISGQIGCLGKATGIVKIINSHTDIQKFKKGDILVSIATNPDLVPAMKKAAAIVTEQGGVTSHAAIVSRELNVPCVIGTKIATEVLKDGDKVEVNANKGIVKKL